MRNFTKILCVALALIVALSAASCTMTKQYSYKTDDVELPAGVYIYFLYSAYNQAQSYAQKSDKYDSEAGTYDGSKSFLKMEITDDDGVTAVAEQWITDKAEKQMRDAVAVYHEYNLLGATLDEATSDYYTEYYKSYWDQSLSETYEAFGISFESLVLASITIPLMRSAVFEAEYKGDTAPYAVSTPDAQAYFEENYTSYKYFSADLYTASTDEAGESTNVAMTEDEIAGYEKAFKAYAEEVNGGKDFSEILDKYNADYSAEATATEDIKNIEEDTEDDILKAVLTLKEGESVSQVIGDSAESKKIYLLYKAPIKDEKDYLSDDNNLLNVLYDMKEDDFDELLKTVADSLKIDISSSCSSYKPSMFEAEK